jgi:diguanylate cyclase (GGDEF)-like protein
VAYDDRSTCHAGRVETMAAVAFGGSVLLAVFNLIRWRWEPGLAWMLPLCLATVGWCWSAWEYERGDLSVRENALWLFCVSATLTGAYFFGRRAWGRHERPPVWQLVVLTVEPVFVLVSGLVAPGWWSTAFASGDEGPPVGWGYIVHSLWCVALILVASGLILRRLERSRGLLRWLLTGSIAAAALGVALQLTGEHAMEIAVVLFVLADTLAFPELARNPMSDIDETARDAVTGLLTRAALDRLVAAAVDRARSHHEALCLIYVDIDRFKDVNDSYGHLVGDAVLHTIAERMSRTTGSHNRVGRFGGDEFVVVVPDQTLVEATTLAHQLVAVCSVPIIHGELTITPAVSAGVAAYDGGTVTDLMDAADRAMYAAKRSGGNRVR